MRSFCFWVSATNENSVAAVVVVALILSLSSRGHCNAFLSPPGTHVGTLPQSLSHTLALSNPPSKKLQELSLSTNGSPDAPKTIEEDAALQWDLFTRHHALEGEWWGIWSTYNYMGDVEDSTVAGVSLQPNEDANAVLHTHRIVSSSTRSECSTCFSSSQVTTLPTIATYTPESLGLRHRCAANGMVVGPSVLKSGAMSTELVLRHGNGRVRVTFQHAPVWERGVEPGSCPPQGLKLFRTVVSKERLRTPAECTGDTIQGPPTADEERAAPPSHGNPCFFRPVPPFKWHAKWSGTSWTWGPTSGDRGWSIAEVDEADAWHGRPTGDAAGTWSLRLPGAVLVQCPRVIVGGMAGICRLAWMPEDGGEVGQAKLLRVEASVSALEPIVSEEDKSMMVGFYPPSLGSLRTDVLEKTGELEGVSLEDRARAAEGYVWGSSESGGVTAAGEDDYVVADDEAMASVAEEVLQPEKKSVLSDGDLEMKIAVDPRNILDL